MPSTPEIPTIVCQRLLAPNGVEPYKRVAGGLSGAQIWQCRGHSHFACLRNWPATHPDEDSLRFIHQCTLIAVENGIRFVPRLYRSSDGMSYVRAQDEFWELTQWMPGEANYSKLRIPERLAAAMCALAELHHCWRAWKHTHGPSPGLARRISLLTNWLVRIQSADIGAFTSSNAHLLRLAQETIAQLHLQAPGLIEQLNEFARRTWLLQPILRDIWSDHVLFVENAVSGIIDYGALAMDCPAIDLARLLGSLEPADVSARQWALSKYVQHIGSTEVTWSVVDIVDRASTLLACGQWLEWLVLEGRQFAQSPDVLQTRWQTLVNRAAAFSNAPTHTTAGIWLP